MARAVLVDGISATEAAHREGVTQQAASMAAARVLRELRAEGGYPPGWTAVTVVVDPATAGTIHALAQRAYRRAGLAV
jgi:hypothetical protein